MLQTIRDSISNLPDKSFSEFYQEYVRSSQDSIINHDISIVAKQYTTLEDTTQILKGLNTITEELKKL